MSKGTKLFRQGKGTKKLERNPATLRRVYDFIARYADPDAFSSRLPMLNTFPVQFPLFERLEATNSESEESCAAVSSNEAALPLIQPIPPTGKALNAELVAGREAPQVKRRKPWRKKTVLFTSGTTQRRFMKRRIRIGSRPVLTTEHTEEANGLFVSLKNESRSSAFLKTAIPSARAPQERVDAQSPMRTGLTALDPCLVSFLIPDSFEAEQYRVLRHLVERLREELGRSCVIAVSSPSAGDGKTTTAINLAGALAQAAGVRVLLIDADLRRPAVLDRLGDQPIANRGLVKAISHPHSWLHNTTVRYPALNLSVLPAGQLTSSSYEIFRSMQFGVLLEEARREYDYIILDTPPLVPIPDCRLIERWVDRFFLVVAAHKTPRKLVQQGLSVIANEKILGMVFNGDDPPVFGYEQYYGYSPRRTSDNSTGSVS